MYSTRLREEAVKMETCILEYIPVMAHVINAQQAIVDLMDDTAGTVHPMLLISKQCVVVR